MEAARGSAQPADKHQAPQCPKKQAIDFERSIIAISIQRDRLSQQL